MKVYSHLKYNDLINLAIIVKYVCRCTTGSIELPMRPDVIRAIKFVHFRIQADYFLHFKTSKLPDISKRA